MYQSIAAAVAGIERAMPALCGASYTCAEAEAFVEALEILGVNGDMVEAFKRAHADSDVEDTDQHTDGWE